MTPEERAEIKKLEEDGGVLPGPWSYKWRPNINKYDIVCASGCVGTAIFKNEAAFIAASRTAVPRLLATVERQDKVIDWLAQAVANLNWAGPKRSAASHREEAERAVDDGEA